MYSYLVLMHKQSHWINKSQHRLLLRWNNERFWCKIQISYDFTWLLSSFVKIRKRNKILHLLFNCLQLILLPKRQLTKRYASFNRVFPLMQISIGSVIIILMGIHEIGVICTSSYAFVLLSHKPCLIVAINVANYFTFFVEIYYIYQYKNL